MLLLSLYGLLIGLILPVSAMDIVDNGAIDSFKLTNSAHSQDKYVSGELLVKFKSDVSKEKIKSINDKHGTKTSYTSPYEGFNILKIPHAKNVEEMVEIYSNNPYVEYAVPNYITTAFMTPNDLLYKYQWNFKEFKTGTGGGINLEPAWDISKGNGVIVAVVDTGVAYENYNVYRKAPDLENTYFVPGYDFVNNDDHPNDDNAHGTHVTGTLAQSTDNNRGVAGIAYGCSIMPVKVLSKEGNGTLQQLVDGIYFATDHGAKVISMSLGFKPGVDPGKPLHKALDYAYGKGVTIVAAAGNDATGTVCYPAAYKKCIAVGATGFNGSLAWYSNYGSEIDVVAPGGDNSTDLDGDGKIDYPYNMILQNTFNSSSKNPTDFAYWFYEGTSMATPHVSGVAALLISKDAINPAQVRSAIQNTATDLGDPGWDKHYGYGLVNATAALKYKEV